MEMSMRTARDEYATAMKPVRNAGQEPQYSFRQWARRRFKNTDTALSPKLAQIVTGATSRPRVERERRVETPPPAAKTKKRR